MKPLVELKCKQLIELCKKEGIDVKLHQGFRSIEEQNRLYQQGRDINGKVIGKTVTNAKGGQSLHNYGVAFDLIIKWNGVYGWSAPQYMWTRMGQLGESLGLEWGGRWKGLVDMPHFELTFGHTWRDFMNGKVDLKKYELPKTEEKPKSWFEKWIDIMKKEGFKYDNGKFTK